MCSRRFLTPSLAIAGSCLLYCSLHAAAVQTSSAEGGAAYGLDAKYKDKLVELRTPYCGQKLQFDATSTLVSGGEPGDPMKCQVVRIQHAAVQDGKLIVTAERVFLRFRTVAVAHDGYAYRGPVCEMEPKTESAQATPHDDSKTQGNGSNGPANGEEVVIEIRLPPQVDNATTAGLMEKLFPTQFVPPSGSASGDTSSGVGPGWERGIFHIGKGVLPPVPIYQPDPAYSEEARDAGFEGKVVLVIIVGADGKVYRPRVSRSLGSGLDEKAIEKVLTWRFKPATRFCVPVAVEVSVEVQFHLPR